MGIPAGALKDDELLHYAALEPEAAAELSRRISEGGLDPGAERDELREEVRMLEGQLVDLEDEKLTVTELIKLALNELE